MNDFNFAEGPEGPCLYLPFSVPDHFLDDDKEEDDEMDEIIRNMVLEQGVAM